MNLQEILKNHGLWLESGSGEKANLRGADLRDADLRDANLRDADLRDANLRDADLSGAILRGANLRDADLRGANLRGANLSGAILRGANLRDADLRGVNLSNTTGLVSATEYLEENFEFTTEGIVVYKSFDEHYSPNPSWDIHQGSILAEVVNQDPTLTCACGINVGTLKWCKNNCKQWIWKCIIRWKWAAGICVPYHTDGKIRAERVELVELI